MIEAGVVAFVSRVGGKVEGFSPIGCEAVVNEEGDGSSDDSNLEVYS